MAQSGRRLWRIHFISVQRPWWQSSVGSSKHVRTSMDHRKHRKAARVSEITAYRWEGGKRGKRELVYSRERRRAVSNLAHLFHRWRLKREGGWTFLLPFLFQFRLIPQQAQTRARERGFSVGDVATQLTGRGNSHNRLQRLLTGRFNASSTLPKLT